MEPVGVPLARVSLFVFVFRASRLCGTLGGAVRDISNGVSWSGVAY